MSSTQLKSAIVVDRLALVRMGLARVFDTVDIDVVAEFSDSKSAVGFVSQNNVDLVVLGAFADSHAINALRRIKQKSEAKSVVLVESLTADDLTELIHMGVDGLLLRTTEISDLADSLGRVLKGERVIGEQFASVAAGEYQVTEDTEVNTMSLTKKELQVLGLMAAGLTNAEIGENIFVTMPTVKTHVAHILAKLGAKRRSEAVARALELGLLR